MTNWTDFVKSFAKKKNLSYGCALSDPDCSAGYRAKYGNPKKVSQKVERERMDAEDIVLPPEPLHMRVKTPKKADSISILKSKIKLKPIKKAVEKQLVETVGMMAEDINRNIVQDIAGNFVGNRPRSYTLPTDETLEREQAGMMAEDKPAMDRPKKKSKGGRKKGSKNKPKGENISMVIEEVKPKVNRGRPQKYATAEEARKAKTANTIAAAKKRKEKKSEGKGIIDTIKEGVKQIFKRTNPVEYAVISGASNILKNPTAVISGRNDFPPKVRQILSKYGSKNITGITLARTPLGKPLMVALQVASGNTFQERLDNTPYDKLFHLFMCIDLAGGKKIMMEKNEVINATIGCKFSGETETKYISSSDIPSGLTLNDALEKQRERMGNNYFGYSAKDNNCQDFIIAFLRANNLGSETDTSWVKQEIKVLFEGNARLRKIANTLTNIGASLDVIKEGAGIKSNSNTNMPNKWITYVKDYAKKNNMKYTDALKDPKCKAGYKSGAGLHLTPDGMMMSESDSDDEKGKVTILPYPLPGKRKQKKPVVGMGMPSSQDEYIAELYNQANLGANGRVDLN